MNDADRTADRLMQMLDLGLAALREGDEDAALLALMEANDTADRLLPKEAISPEAICLPYSPAP
jgi:hypothetical protein